jgi:protein ImuB
MSRSYACIISPDKTALVAVARQFAHSIEVIDVGILFDVSGLERLIGKPERVAQKILEQMQKQNVAGSIAVAETVDTAVLLARGKQAEACTLNTTDKFQQLPLTDLTIEQDTLNVFGDLGLHTVEDLLAVPRDALVNRYGQEFQNVIDTIEQKGISFLTPNVKEGRVAWRFDLDQAVEDFEQLIFVLNHGLESLFGQVVHHGFSTEHLDISFKLGSKTRRDYEIKTSFPTLERSFWLKLINLRISLDPPEAAIAAVNVIAHFTKPRPAQRGLYAVSRPEPESLLLTVNKLQKLVGEDNVGVPVILDQRLAEPFALDGARTPSSALVAPDATLGGRGRPRSGIIALNYFRPPVRAEVLVRDGRLVFIKTRQFAAHVLNYSGVWRSNSKWWDRPWRTQEWDIEVENAGVYRLCKAKDEWFVTGEYD